MLDTAVKRLEIFQNERNDLYLQQRLSALRYEEYSPRDRYSSSGGTVHNQ